jgi:hypothetical protein
MNDFSVIHDFFGDGYGAPTKGGEEAMKMAKELEGLKLDPTYSGKAMAGFIDFVKKAMEKASAFSSGTLTIPCQWIMCLRAGQQSKWQKPSAD